MKSSIIAFALILFLSILFTGCINKNESAAVRNVRMEEKTPAVQINNSPVKPNTTLQICEKPEVPVLCYHRIINSVSNEYEVTSSTFAAHIKALSDSGFHSVSPDQLYEYLVFNKPLPEKPFMVTFDDSRTEHFEIAAPVLEKYGFRGVFFVMTVTINKKNYLTKEQIVQLSNSGHTIGLHSWNHIRATKYENPKDWEKQVEDPKNKLEIITGKKVDYWAYPDGIYNHRSAEELSKFFKLSFILAAKGDPDLPLQTIRRMIAAEWTPAGLIRALHRTFNKKKTTKE